MSISTKSVFYYGHDVDETNYTVDFSENGTEKNATLNIGDYTFEEFATEIQRAMNVAGDFTYNVTTDRDDRTLTIEATDLGGGDTFSLLISSGSMSGLTAYTLMGFTGSDQTGSASYTGSTSGSEWLPQAVIREYLAFEDFEEFIDESVQIAASNEIQVLTYGDQRFMEGNFQLITDLTQGAASDIDNDASGRTNARNFMKYAKRKTRLEFMPDRDDRETYYKCILESTTDNRAGTGFALRKMFDEGVVGYYTLGKLVFREVS